MINTEKRKGGWGGNRDSFGLACLALLMFVFAVLPASAATQYVVVNRYAANNYSVISSSDNVSCSEMQTSFPNVYSNGPVYFQGPTFNASDPYGYAGENMINYYGHNGTYVRNLTDLVGMSAGDEIVIKASDGMTRYFNYTNVYTPYNDGTYAQGNMILAWWDSVYGAVPAYSDGIRLFFYDPPASYGVADSLNMTLPDMYHSLAPWYRYNYSGTWPSAKGLSVKYVNELKIYPPHLHDFNTTGDTSGWAYKGEVSLDPPSTLDLPGTLLSSISDIADHDSSTETISSNSSYAAQRFNFLIDTPTDKDGPVNKIEKLSISWIGSGYHDDSDEGLTLYIWNGSSYEELASTNSGTEVTLNGERSSNIEDYVNSGNVTVIVVQKSPGEGPDSLSSLATDYIKLVVTHHHSNM